MVVDIVDAQNRPVGTVKRRDIFKTPGGFRTVHAFIFSSQGELLLQQQARTRERAPLSWGSSVAAYLFAGESYEQAAARRIEQELGVRLANLKLVGVVKVDDLGHDKFVGLVECQSDGPFQPDSKHIERLQFTPRGKIDQSRRKGEVTFTPTFLLLWRLYRRSSGQSSPKP
jgi:isopentenyl-diphosphate delta-isomerase